MKEIKFRAWDKSFKVMRKVTMVNFYNSDIAIEVQSDTIYMSGERPTAQRLLSGGQYELMQFTCLKDKNGVDIYEGDIVQADGEYGDGLTGEIYYKNGCFMLQEHALYQIYNVEVIGNIYENPELIKEAAE